MRNALVIAESNDPPPTLLELLNIGLLHKEYLKSILVLSRAMV